MPQKNLELEWCLTSPKGYFAMGCADLKPRRKYHSFLAIPEGLNPNSQAKNIIAKVTEEMGTTNPNERFPFLNFESNDTVFPSWTSSTGSYLCEKSLELVATEIDSAPFSLRYKFSKKLNREKAVPKEGDEVVKMRLFPHLLSRPLHGLSQKNPVLNGAAEQKAPNSWTFQPYEEEAKISFTLVGAESTFIAEGHWVREDYEWEKARGYASQEDLFVPGFFEVAWDTCRPLSLILTISLSDIPVFETKAQTSFVAPGAIQKKTEFKSFSLKRSLQRAALGLCFETQSQTNRMPVIVAGLPWFGPWARDTLISLPGYYLASKNSQRTYFTLLNVGSEMLRSLGDPAETGSPQMNLHGADSPWLYFWALEFLMRRKVFSENETGVLKELGRRIVEGVLLGRQSHVSFHERGLIRVDVGPWAGSWMDAVVDGVPLTPRHGFAIEINALFISALGFLRDNKLGFETPLDLAAIDDRALEEFPKLFFGKKQMADLVDKEADFSLRPNLLFALSLPRVPVPEDLAKHSLDQVRKELLTPVGLRSLAKTSPSYKGIYTGTQAMRDAAYHQGTVWPWLFGIYADSLARWEGVGVVRTELSKFLEQWKEHIQNEGCIGYVSEIFDGDSPHLARGAPVQAWSACEMYRVIDQYIDESIDPYTHPSEDLKAGDMR